VTPCAYLTIAQICLSDTAFSSKFCLRNVAK